MGKIISDEIDGHTQVVLTNHCLERMRDRGVSQQEVIKALRKPTKSLPAFDGKLNVRKNRTDTEFVDVVYCSEGKSLVVVTVIVVRKK